MDQRFDQAIFRSLSRRTALIGGGIFVLVVAVLFGVNRWLVHSRLLRGGDLLSVIPAQQDGWMHVQLEAGLSSTASISRDQLSTMIRSTVGMDQAQWGAWGPVIGNELALYAPQTGDSRSVVIVEIKQVNGVEAALRQLDPAVSLTKRDSGQQGSLHHAAWARRLTSTDEKATIHFLLTDHWLAASPVADDLIALQQSAESRQASLRQQLSAEAWLTPATVRGFLPAERQHDWLPTSLQLPDQDLWWSLQVDDQLNLIVATKPWGTPVPSFTANTEIVHGQPAVGDIVWQGRWAGSAAPTNQLAPLVTALSTVPLASLTELLEGLPYVAVLRPANDRWSTLVDVTLDRETMEAQAQTIETVLTRYVSRLAPKTQDRTLFDGTVVSELFPNPGAIERMELPPPANLTNLTSWRLNGTEVLLTGRSGRQFLIAQSLDLLYAYLATDQWLSSDCQVDGDTVIDFPTTNIPWLTTWPNGRLVVGETVNDGGQRLSLCLE